MKIRIYVKLFLFVFTTNSTFVCSSWANELDAPLPKKIMVFILAGQSNMEGANGQTEQLKKLLCAADEYSIDGNACYSGSKLFDRLFNTITDHYRIPGQSEPGYNYDPVLVENEANAVSRLYKQRIFRSPLLAKLDKVNIISLNYKRNSDGSLRDPNISYGKMEPGYGGSSIKYGPELAMGHWLSKKTDSDILFIKVVQGGSSLYEQWRSPTMGQKLPPTNKESLYPKLIEWTNLVTNNVTDYFPEYAGYDLDVKIRGFFWFQGFNDMLREDFASAYEENITDFLTDLRYDLSSPDLPIILATDATNSSKGTIIQQAQREVSRNFTPSNYVTTRDLSAYYHYDSASHIIIGKRFAKSMWKLIRSQ